MKNKYSTSNTKKSQKRYISFLSMFSGASIIGITFTTVFVFAIMMYFSIDNTISLRSSNVITVFVLTPLISAIITFTLRKIFFMPLIRLTEAMNKVAAGDFSIKLDCDIRQRDITKVYASFNTMVSELAQTETLQTDFISNVSHEFKTPINALEGYASLLQDSSLSPEEQSLYVDKIMFNTRRLSDLVGSVLLLSKVSNQKIQHKKSRYRLDEQIRYSVLALESKWEPKNIDFDIELEEIEYTGTETLMGHVWINLVDNAVKFSDHGGEIRIRLQCIDENAIFTVSNKGAYIPEDALDRVFNKFYQCDTSRKSEGNGLGLPLAKMILSSFGGEIHVESSEQDGTKFTVTLPLSDDT